MVAAAGKGVSVVVAVAVVVVAAVVVIVVAAGIVAVVAAVGTTVGGFGEETVFAGIVANTVADVAAVAAGHIGGAAGGKICFDLGSSAVGEIAAAAWWSPGDLLTACGQSGGVGRLAGHLLASDHGFGLGRRHFHLRVAG